MSVYRVVIDDEMIINSLQTNIAESSDLISLRMIFYFVFLGLLPSLYVYFSKVKYFSLKQEVIRKGTVIIASTIMVIAIIMTFSKFYASLGREHKSARYYINPLYWIYSAGKVALSPLQAHATEFTEIGLDAKIVEPENSPKELIIMVVGEAARADHFSINGYERETNPLLKQENIISFSNMKSCGTSTAVSVPCIFSILNRNDYNHTQAKYTGNVLDVLASTGKVEVLWRDNNSSSKGVADRVIYEDYKTPEKNTICDEECRDEGMLIGLDTYIESHPNKDILIVLHQMGNHGPAYYKRYPKAFEKFTPVCTTNQLEECTTEEIQNAYDNAILYTDYFLSKAINFLKIYSDTHETALIYISDHGESLGENNLYLHGLPYLIAPNNQKHVGAFIWVGSLSDDYDPEIIKEHKDNELTHDNIFHTLLGIYEIDSEVYDPKLNILYPAIKHAN